MAQRELAFTVTARTDGLERGLRLGSREVRKFQRDADRAGSSTRRFGLEMERLERGVKGGALTRGQAAGLATRARFRALQGPATGQIAGRLGLGGVISAGAAGGAAGAAVTGAMLALESIRTGIQTLIGVTRRGIDVRQRARATGFTEDQLEWMITTARVAGISEQAIPVEQIRARSLASGESPQETMHQMLMQANAPGDRLMRNAVQRAVMLGPGGAAFAEGLRGLDVRDIRAPGRSSEGVDRGVVETLDRMYGAFWQIMSRGGTEDLLKSSLEGSWTGLTGTMFDILKQAITAGVNESILADRVKRLDTTDTTGESLD